MRILRHLVPDKVQERSLDPAETVVQARNVGFGEVETVGIAQFGEPVDDRAAGIAQAQHLGALVEGLPHRVVDGLAQDFVFQGARHLNDLGVTAGNEQAQVRE